MSEQINLQPPDALSQHEATQVLALEALNPTQIAEHLDTMQDIPEVTENREAILHAATELSTTFQVEASIADDPGKMTLFMAIANRWSKAGETETAEKTFLADSMALLANKNSGVLKEIHDGAKKESVEYSDEHREAVLARYTNTQMTEALTTAIHGGLLSGVKERLGVTDQNEDPYQIAVLSISDSYALSGMRPDSNSWPMRGDYANEAEYQAAVDHINEQMVTLNDVNSWSEGLQNRGLEFMKDYGVNFVPTAWKTEINGTTYLCMPQSFVEKIIHKDYFVDELKSNHYTEDDWDRDFAVLEHEYTHTQGGLNVDDELAFGINLEELRAEHFSGNKNGYSDIKNFARDVGLITGTDLVEYIETKQKGGNSDDVFQEIAQNVGLDAMLEVVMAQPRAYVENSENELIKATNEYLGGYDGVITRLMEQQITKGNESSIMDRVDTRIKKLSELEVDIAWVMNYRRSCGLTVLSDLVEQRAVELGYIKSDD